MDEVGEIIRRRISTRLDRLGLTPITAAQKAFLPRDTIRNLYRGDGSVPRADTLAQIAKALETSVAYLVGEREYAESVDELSEGRRNIAIVCRLGYDRWWTRDELQRLGALPVDVRGYATANLFAGTLTDRHAALYYPEGASLIFAPIAEGGIRANDHVLVKEERDGSLQFTVRALQNKWGGLELAPLAPKRFAPKMRPLRYEQPFAEGEIVGTVIAAYWETARDAAPGFYPYTPVQLDDEDEEYSLREPPSGENAT